MNVESEEDTDEESKESIKPGHGDGRRLFHVVLVHTNDFPNVNKQYQQMK